jgi:hypothetical protein
MGYSAIDMDSTSAPQGKSFMGAFAGAAIGAVVGAVVLGAVVAVDRAVATPATSLYAATAVRPAVTGSMAAVPVRGAQATRAAAGVQYAAAQQAGVVDVAQLSASTQAPQTAVYSWAFVLFAAVAGAVNGLFLWNSNKKVAMAATTGRREALMAAGVAAGVATAKPAFAAYGEPANVFGKKAEVDQFLSISGAGWSAIIPGKYNPSKERNEFPGTVARYEDNFDAVSYTNVSINPVGGKTSVTELGSIDDVRNAYVRPLLGLQAWEGSSISEGGFADGRVSAAALLDQSEVTKDGKVYYQYELLTRTADGNEGGRHQLFSVAVSGGNLYILKNQVGDKRWFKGLERPVKKSNDTFTVA